jgi:hypothetical protein
VKIEFKNTLKNYDNCTAYQGAEWIDEEHIRPFAVVTNIINEEKPISFDCYIPAECMPAVLARAPKPLIAPIEANTKLINKVINWIKDQLFTKYGVKL